MIIRNRAGFAKGVAAIVAAGLLASACGGSSKSGPTKPSGPATTQGQQQAADEGKPVYGGTAVYGLPAETSGGYCDTDSQLAISGIQVNRALFDTLTVPDVKGEYKPYLAESVTSNPAFTQWTVKLRSGVKFHDGSALTAAVVKNNLDAYRGAYDKKRSDGTSMRKSQLFVFVFLDMTAVKAVDDLTLEITTKPWASFPATLYGSGRLGIMAQAQLDDEKTCDTKPIGTGPFKMQSWVKDDHLTVVKNPDYWRKDTGGGKLPYLDQIDFKPITASSQMQNGIASGGLDLALDDGGPNIVAYRELNKANKIKLSSSDVFPELSYTIFNVTKPPFNNIHARLAYAHAVDRDKLNQIRYKGVFTRASGPFGPGVLGFLADPGLPKYDPAAAKAEMALYKKDTGKDLEFTYTSAGTDPTGLADIDFIKTYMTNIGIKMNVKAVDESTGINAVIGKDFSVAGWRNHPGYDPDTEYVWWHCSAPAGGPCENLVNFNGFNDAVINKAFEVARASNDPAVRKTQYETINRQFAKMVYNGWGFYSLWTIPSAKRLSGVGTLPIPGGNKPFPGYTSGVDPAGLWVTK